MKSRVVYWYLAVAAFLCLATAAVWMGGLNQDEGWYLYAANLAADGAVPYRDFAFTQGPVMPRVYSLFTWVWKTWGLLGARVFTLSLGMLGIVVATLMARRLTPSSAKGEATLVAFFLLATNLYHLYYVTIPKTYALAGLFVLAGFYFLNFSRERAAWSFLAGVGFAFAAGTRISLGAILPVVGVWTFWQVLRGDRTWPSFFAFALGGFGGLALVYGPSLSDPATREGLLAAQAYHAARGGSDLTWVVGSLSRLVRWYLPVFIVLGLGGFRRGWILFAAFLAVFAVQMLAPFPYDDYQVPVMPLLAVFAAVNFVSTSADKAADGKTKKLLLVLGLCFATAFGSPLLEKWSTNGQDRFWSLKKAKTELAQLREMAATIEAIDPHGTELMTQDLYLAVETNRRVPKGLEMGPFAILSDDEWRRLLETVDCPVAALSGYTFAIMPPSCAERPFGQQVEFWNLLKRRYQLVLREDLFGQNATPLLILMRK